MKKISLVVAALLVFSMAGTALAADILYPSDIVEYQDGEHERINKVYVLTKQDDPALIPTADFERDGFTYALLDMTRQDNTETDSRAYSETVTVESSTKDTEAILAQLVETMEVATQDGYNGVLELDKDSIKAVPSGYGTSSRQVSATRSYPNLSDADVSFIPKSIEDSGRVLELSDVRWQEAGGYFHATATYTGTVTSRYVKSYTVTADYVGEVSKIISDEVVYTAIFGGKPIQILEVGDTYQIEQEYETEAANSNLLWYILIPILLVGVAAAVIGLLNYRKKKARRY